MGKTVLLLGTASAGTADSSGVFAAAGVTLSPIADEREAAERASQARPEAIVVSDLPSRNALSLCSELRRSPALQQVPVIVLCESDASTMVRMHKLSPTRADAYVNREATAEALLAVLHPFVSDAKRGPTSAAPPRRSFKPPRPATAPPPLPLPPPPLPTATPALRAKSAAGPKQSVRPNKAQSIRPQSGSPRSSARPASSVRPPPEAGELEVLRQRLADLEAKLADANARAQQSSEALEAAHRDRDVADEQWTDWVTSAERMASEAWYARESALKQLALAELSCTRRSAELAISREQTAHSQQALATLTQLSETLREEIESLESAARDAATAMRDIAAARSAAEAELTSVSKDMDAALARSAEERAQFDATMAAREVDHRRRIESVARDASSARAELDRKIRDVESATKEIEGLSARIAIADERIAELSQSCDELRTAAVDASGAATQLAVQERSLSSTRAELDRVSRALAGTRAERDERVGSLSTELTATQARLAARERSATTEANNASEALRSAQERTRALDGRIVDLESRLEEGRQTVEQSARAFEAHVVAAEQQWAQFETDSEKAVNSLRDRVRELDAEVAAERTRVQSLESDGQNREREVERLKEELGAEQRWVELLTQDVETSRGREQAERERFERLLAESHTKVRELVAANEKAAAESTGTARKKRQSERAPAPKGDSGRQDRKRMEAELGSQLEELVIGLTMRDAEIANLRRELLTEREVAQKTRAERDQFATRSRQLPHALERIRQLEALRERETRDTTGVLERRSDTPASTEVDELRQEVEFLTSEVNRYAAREGERR